MTSLLQKIASENNLKFHSFEPLFGGDINTVVKLMCDNGNYVIKLNSADKFPKMFETEAYGLELLRKSNSFKIPEVIASGTINHQAYLMLEFIPEGNPTNQFWQKFAENLAVLHQTTQSDFGLSQDNYIGSLPQKNDFKSSITEFYISNRLEPQFRLAQDFGFRFKNLEMLYKNISNEIPNEKPALIHGDLWSGNFMVSASDEPVLIDPAVSFCSREMDLAMMQLFGGFPQEVFRIYHEKFPLSNGWKNRVDIWQLYYLLVHLNLFGAGYLEQVNFIIKKYS